MVENPHRPINSWSVDLETLFIDTRLLLCFNIRALWTHLICLFLELHSESALCSLNRSRGHVLQLRYVSLAAETEQRQSREVGKWGFVRCPGIVAPPTFSLLEDLVRHEWILWKAESEYQIRQLGRVIGSLWERILQVLIFNNRNHLSSCLSSQYAEHSPVWGGWVGV